MHLDSSLSLDVGLLSDTHLPYRMKRLPRQVFHAFAGVDVILHAGDVDRPAALEPLREIAPVYAVRGNVHFLDLSSGGISLPHLVELRLAGHRVLLTHGYLPGLASFWFKGRDVTLRLLGASDKGRFNERIARRLKRLHPRADIVVFGHTHRAYVGWIGDTLLVNPGAVSPILGEQPSVARMWLGTTRPEVEILPLQSIPVNMGG
jgi:putative phosphoesterase